MDTHPNIIKEMSKVMKKLASAYIESGKYTVGDCLHCDAYELIGRAKAYDCVPVEDAAEYAGQR